jgi:tripartite-type tricarboxylate transporter receptor subunit TctC
MKKLAFVVVQLCGLLFISRACAQTEPFYKGKTIKIIVGIPAGGIVDSWARLIAQHMGKHIAGNPDFIVQNMPGGGSMVAANHLYNIAKPDGLTLGMISTALYFDQVAGKKEVQFDWAKFQWIGSPVRNHEILVMRANTPFKSFEDVRKAAEPPRCGATGTGTTSHYFPRFVEEALGVKFHMVTGYPGTRDIEVATERGEIHCYAATKEVLTRDPSRAWVKDGVIRVLVQGGAKRDASMPDAPTIYELMEQYKTPNEVKRVAPALLSPGASGRPMIAPPALPAERVKLLRDAYQKTLGDPDFLDAAKKREWEVERISGEELEAIARKAVSQPPETVERLKKIMGE